MLIQTLRTERGFSLEITGSRWQAPPCRFSYPEEVWQTFPAKDALIQELAYITTLVTPLILEHPEIHYDTPAPRFMQTYHDGFEAAIPNFVQHIKNEDATEILHRFRSIRRTFADKSDAPLPGRQNSWKPTAAVLPFSYGKDSLLSLATMQELGYEMQPVNIMECVQPRMHALRQGMQPALEKEFGIQCLELRNELQLLSDYEVLNRPETRLHQCHVHFVYSLGMLPFCYYFSAPAIVLSNEFNNSMNRVHRQGLIAPYKAMQTGEMTRTMSALISKFSGGAVSIVNPIGGLGDYAINQLLLHRFRDYGKYRVSCDMEISPYTRWCHNCVRCAQAYLFALAEKVDPMAIGFETAMLSVEKLHHFAVSKGTPHAEDEQLRFSQSEERLAAIRARHSGCDSEVLDHFPGCGNERETRELHEAIFRYQTSPESRVERQAAQLYRRLLPGPETSVSYT